MKSPYVCDLKPNQVFTSTFLVHVKDVRQKKSGDPYLSLLLGDRTGDVDAKMWDNVAEVIETFDRDDFVKVKGLLQIFQNRPQLTVHKMTRVLDSDVDFADYFPVSERDPLEMFAELRGIVAGMANPHLRALLNAFLDDQPFARLYRTAPAAKHVHHAHLSGLIEHVLSVCHLCRMAAAHYSYIDPDLLLTGAILHDIGKVAELTYDRSFGYTAEGQLLGHIVIGLRMLYEKLQRVPDFPPKLRVLVEHMIVSHHGELEFGSPKVPLFPEALLLHHLDNLDSKMECMRRLVANDRHVDGCWTAYNASLERSVLKKAKYLGEEPSASASAGPAAPPSSSAVPSAPAPPPSVAPSSPADRPAAAPSSSGALPAAPTPFPVAPPSAPLERASPQPSGAPPPSSVAPSSPAPERSAPAPSSSAMLIGVPPSPSTVPEQASPQQAAPPPPASVADRSAAPWSPADLPTGAPPPSAAPPSASPDRPAPPPPRRGGQPAPRAGSIFAEKLQQAWRKEP